MDPGEVIMCARLSFVNLYPSFIIVVTKTFLLVFRLEMLQQIANRVQRDCVNGEDKLALARTSLQSVSFVQAQFDTMKPVAQNVCLSCFF